MRERIPLNRTCYRIPSTRKSNGAVWCATHDAWLNTCKQCGQTMHSKRPQTLTCSDKCRKAKSRANRLHNANKKQKTQEFATNGGGELTQRKLAILASRWYTEIKGTS